MAEKYTAMLADFPSMATFLFGDANFAALQEKFG